MILSTVAVTADTNELEIISSDTPIGGYGGENNKGTIVWNNGMMYDGLHPAQEDNTQPLDAYPADDFKFNDTTHICDVHWIGGYWGAGYNTAKFDWCIEIYSDQGDEKAPGPLMCSYWLSHNECNPQLIEDTGLFIFYNFTAYLPEPCCIVSGGQVHWISIYAIGDIYPQSGWGFHKYPIRLHEAVFKSVYFGYSGWTDTSIVFNNASDMCFQLTVNNTPPGETVITGPTWGIAEETYVYKFNAIDPDDDEVKYHIDWGDENSDTTGFNPSGTDVTVSHSWAAEGTYSITAFAEDEEGLIGPEGTFEVTMPRNLVIQNTIFLWFLEKFLILHWLFQKLI